MTLDPKAAGEIVYLVGETRDETGGSEYFRFRGELAEKRAPLGDPAPFVGNRVPLVDLERALDSYLSLERAIREGVVRSIGVVAMGGLAVALARMAMAAELGFELDFAVAELAPDVALFSESLGRLVITVPADDAARFEALVAGQRIGTVSREPRLRMALSGTTVVDVGVADLKSSFGKTLGGGS